MTTPTGSDHPSRLDLAGALLGAAPGPLAHARECAACAAWLAEARADADRFAAAVYPRTADAVLARIRRGRRRRWLAGGAAGLVLAAAALLLALRVGPRAEPALGIKGVALQVVGRRGDHTFAVRDGAVLRAGDALRFSITTGAPGWVLVASVDGRGAASVYYPSTPIPAGATTLPGSIVLDDAPGPERVFALLAGAPIDETAVRRALAELAARGPRAIRAARRLPLPPSQVSFLLEKER